jgi:uncharacterized membrane protein
MFDTIAGLPVHPLVVHAAVVLGPLAALLLLIYTFKPAWRVGLKWPTVLTGVVSGLSAAVASASGESLQHRVDQQSTAAARQLVEDHAEAGDMAAFSLYVLAAAIVVVIFFLIPAVARDGRATWLKPAGLVVSLVAVAFATFGVVNAGHSGAKASWTEVVSSTTGGGEG